MGDAFVFCPDGCLDVMFGGLDWHSKDKREIAALLLFAWYRECSPSLFTLPFGVFDKLRSVL